MYNDNYNYDVIRMLIMIMIENDNYSISLLKMTGCPCIQKAIVGLTVHSML